MTFPWPNHVNPCLMILKLDLMQQNLQTSWQVSILCILKIKISVWKIHDFCHFLTNSMIIPGPKNKKHFPWLFQAAGTLFIVFYTIYFFFFMISVVLAPENLKTQKCWFPSSSHVFQSSEFSWKDELFINISIFFFKILIHAVIIVFKHWNRAKCIICIYHYPANWACLCTAPNLPILFGKIMHPKPNCLRNSDMVRCPQVIDQKNIIMF